MKFPVWLVACAIAFTFAARADIIPGSYSPDKRFAIAEIDGDYCIIETAHHRQLGSVIPLSQESKDGQVAISNIDIQEIRWTKDESKVAFVLYYGTKLGELLICQRDAKGKYKLVDFHYPDALEFYKHTFPKYRNLDNNGGNDEFHAGHWINNDTINLISGEAADVEKKDDSHVTYHFLVGFKVTISSEKASVSKVSPAGVVIGDDDDDAVAAWEKTH